MGTAARPGEPRREQPGAARVGAEIPLVQPPSVQKYPGSAAGAEMPRVWAAWVHLCGSFRPCGEGYAASAQLAITAQSPDPSRSRRISVLGPAPNAPVLGAKNCRSDAASGRIGLSFPPDNGWPARTRLL